MSLLSEEERAYLDFHRIKTAERAAREQEQASVAALQKAIEKERQDALVYVVSLVLGGKVYPQQNEVIKAFGLTPCINVKNTTIAYFLNNVKVDYNDILVNKNVIAATLLDDDDKYQVFIDKKNKSILAKGNRLCAYVNKDNQIINLFVITKKDFGEYKNLDKSVLKSYNRHK